jgi:hypothetical protein
MLETRVEDEERDRPGCCHRRLADGLLADGPVNQMVRLVSHGLAGGTPTSARGTHALPDFI